MSSRRFEAFVLVGWFVISLISSFIGCTLSILTFNTIEPEPVIVKVVIQNPERISPEDIEAIIEPQAIGNDFDIMQPCGYTVEELRYALSDEYRCQMLPYVDAFLEAEETYGINAFYLMCKFGLESGWGKYMAAENNISGWTNADGSYRNFDSVDSCIMHVAKNLSTTYRKAVGSKIDDVCARYCQNDGYLETLLGIMQDREAVIEAKGRAA